MHRSDEGTALPAEWQDFPSALGRPMDAPADRAATPWFSPGHARAVAQIAAMPLG